MPLDNSRKLNFETTVLPSVLGQSPDSGSHWECPAPADFLALLASRKSFQRACPWSVKSSKSPQSPDGATGGSVTRRHDTPQKGCGTLPPWQPGRDQAWQAGSQLQLALRSEGRE